MVIPKGVHTVQSKGKTYYYAWRGGPRLTLTPDNDGFKHEYFALRKSATATAGKRKRVLRTSLRATITIVDAVNVAIDNARQRARKRSLPFDLTAEFLLDRLQATNGKCELSGLPFVLHFDPNGSYAHNPYGVSIDRIVPANGYTQGNVRIVLTALNFAINQWGLEAYLEIAKAVAKRAA